MQSWGMLRFIISRTLFATHYFELTYLAEEQKSIHNVHLNAMEYGDKIVFYMRLSPGHPIDKAKQKLLQL